MIYPDDEEVMELAIKVGHILLENGAEIFRVEDTMHRICNYYGVKSESAFVLANGIFVTAGNKDDRMFAKVEHIHISGTHFDKVAAVNQLSREIEEGKYSVEEAWAELDRITKMKRQDPWTLVLASGFGAAGFCYILGGSLLDSCVAFLSGLVLYLYICFFCSKHPMSKIVTNIIGGAIVTVICGLFYLSGMGHLNAMIGGSIMPMVPGVAFTNSIRDLANGDYIAGAVRMLDALVVFFSIAMGVGMAVTVLNALTGGGLL